MLNQLTKLRQDVKAKIEDNFQYGGQRTASQARRSLAGIV